MLAPLKISAALFDIYIAPPTPNALPPYFLFSFAELTLSKKLLVPVKCSELATAKIAHAPTSELLRYVLLWVFLRKVVVPVNVSLLLRAVTPHPNIHFSVNG